MSERLLKGIINGLLVNAFVILLVGVVICLAIEMLPAAVAVELDLRSAQVSSLSGDVR